MISNRYGTPKITLAEITTTNWSTIVSSNSWKKFQKTCLRISVVLHVIGSLNTPAYLTTWRASLVNICFSYSVEILAIKTGRRVDSKCLQCPAPTFGWTGGERWFSVPILSWSKIGLAVTANKAAGKQATRDLRLRSNLDWSTACCYWAHPSVLYTMRHPSKP